MRVMKQEDDSNNLEVVTLTAEDENVSEFRDAVELWLQTNYGEENAGAVQLACCVYWDPGRDVLDLSYLPE